MFGSAYAAQAADKAPPAADSGWTYNITQLGWIPKIKADAAMFGSPVLEVDLKFKDIIKDVNWSDFPPIWEMNGEIRNGRFGLFSEVISAALEVSGSTSGPPAASLTVDLRMTVVTTLGSYRVAEQDKSHLDVVAGARLYDVRPKLKVAIGFLAGSAKDYHTWVDPVVGFKGNYELGNNFFVEGWGLIGGFDVSSKFMWDAWGGLGYRVNNLFSASAGWRHLSVDYEKGAFLFDADIDGPMLNFHFDF